MPNYLIYFDSSPNSRAREVLILETEPDGINILTLFNLSSFRYDYCFKAVYAPNDDKLPYEHICCHLGGFPQ